MNNVDFKKLFLKKNPLIDVRAPVEFSQGHLPGAVNLPILNNEERSLIGTIYKKEGHNAAVELGYKLVSGDVKNSRLNKWLRYIEQNPETVIYCFRGGLRSQTTQKWLQEAGVVRPLIQGGYKRARKFLIDEVNKFANESSLLILSGTTGSGKTSFLNEVKPFCPILDIEALACHRGSAFGAMNFPQPTQANFENQMAVSLLDVQDYKKPLLVEDESKLIGSCAIPKSFFNKMRESPVLWIDESLETRVNNIFQDYVIEPMLEKETLKVSDIFDKYKASMIKISKKLGGLRTQELLNLLTESEKEFFISKDLSSNKLWIEKLLIYYYDPMYLDSLDRRRVKILFKGSRNECVEFLRDEVEVCSKHSK